MKIRIKIDFKHRWAFWFFALCLSFIVATPFSLICMFLVGDSPFWMWQIIFMFFAGIFLLEKK